MKLQSNLEGDPHGLCFFFVFFSDATAEPLIRTAVIRSVRWRHRHIHNGIKIQLNLYRVAVIIQGESGKDVYREMLMSKH